MERPHLFKGAEGKTQQKETPARFRLAVEAALKCLDLSPEDCRKKAEQFTWDRSVDRFLEVLFPTGQ